MSFTIDVEENTNVRIADADLTVESADTVAFAVDGSVSVGRGLLARFAGSRLTPDRLALAVDDDVVEIDLSDEAALRLDVVDVGVSMPDGAASGDGPVPEPNGSSLPTGASDLPDLSDAGRISFTIEGVVEDVPPAAAERLAGAEATPRSLTFSVDDPPETDGGDPGEPSASFGLLGFRITVRADGTIAVTALDGVDVGPL